MTEEEIASPAIWGATELAKGLGLTTPELEDLHENYARDGRRLVRALCEIYGFETVAEIIEGIEPPVLNADGEEFGDGGATSMERYDPDLVASTAKAGSRLPSNFLRSNQAVEVGNDDTGTLLIAVADENDFILQQRIRRAVAPDRVRFVLADEFQIRSLIPKDDMEDTSDLSVYDDFQEMIDRDIIPLIQQSILQTDEPEEIVASRMIGESLVSRIFEAAMLARATDIHIDPYGPNAEEPNGGFTVRFRVDKILRNQTNMSRSGIEGLRTADVIARTLKMQSGVDISERVPADFRVARTVGRRTVYARVHTHPAHVGSGDTATKSTIRILEGRRRSLDSFGFTPDLLGRWRTAIDEGWGLSLVSGPMGSGKSSAVFASLPEIINDALAAFSVEDPVEFDIPGVTQYEINARNLIERQEIMTRTLHDLRRQDANFVLIGEIRDKQSMELAFDLASSGVRVLATVHAASAIHTVQRLLEWELDPFIVATTLRAVLNMRLLQRLCQRCKVEVDHEDQRLWPDEIFGQKLPDKGYIPNPDGCSSCDYSGTVGQFPIGELLRMGKASPASLKTTEGVSALALDIISLEAQAYEALCEGKTHVQAVRNAQIGSTSELLLSEEISSGDYGITDHVEDVVEIEEIVQ